jgi:CYTH domain-containing protein
MPTENERKYILDIGCVEEVKNTSFDRYEISQGYLIATRGITVRIRRFTKSSGKVNYFFTLKVTTSGRTIEIEKSIDERDFNDLWNIALNKLEKTRYLLKDDNVWEVDFFKDYKDQVYICVAEVELPEDQYEPHSIPSLIQKRLLYTVPLTDTRFSNKLLGDARYASQLLKEIRKGLKNEVQFS